ncbi:intermembrane transport protein PqiB [Kangiella sp. TOML190]|uniref:intermembrane transport protein PqiB n=1 Tax=Kangiella sp. TOML190 TaxID=2931351 RepID=UPI00203A447A|nr:intermembrane transport protein PqiB [Kangiella sp. TOML190]
MSDNLSGSKPNVKKKAKVSKIWIVPIVALLLGLGMIWNYFQQKGVDIEIAFLTADSIEAGKTKVKTRNVDIGTVKKVNFNEDRSKVVIQVEIDKDMKDFLRQDTNFWVVKPRVGKDGVSGLGTLLSGAFIELSPGISDQFQDEFVGLEEPPITLANSEGMHLRLLSKDGKPVNRGSPVLYRGFTVGKVESSKFDVKKRQTVYDIFINKPYDELVTTNTFFWNVGGLSVETTIKGLKVNMPSVESLLAGGIQFDVPTDLSLGTKLTEPKDFILYPDENSIYEDREYEYLEYALLVEDSVGGLYAGAPVEYRGIRIGTVKTPYLKYDEKTKIAGKQNASEIIVIIKIEPGRITGTNNRETLDKFNEEFKGFIKSGLVASIESANLLLGSLRISLDYTGNPAENLENYGPYHVIPTVSGGLGKIAIKVSSLLDKFNELPLDKTVGGANKALGSADQALLSMDKALQELTSLLQQQSIKQLPQNLDQSLVELQKTLQGFQPNSAAYKELEKTMSQLQETMQDLQPLLKSLSNKPNSLIFGGQQGADPEPQAKEK